MEKSFRLEGELLDGTFKEPYKKKLEIHFNNVEEHKKIVSYLKKVIVTYICT